MTREKHAVVVLITRFAVFSGQPYAGTFSLIAPFPKGLTYAYEKAMRPIIQPRKSKSRAKTWQLVWPMCDQTAGSRKASSKRQITPQGKSSEQLDEARNWTENNSQGRVVKKSETQLRSGCRVREQR